MKTVFLLLIAVGLLGSGCAIQIGNRAPDQDTLGQELMDLKKAKDSGAISDNEYETQKAKLLSAK